jgi:hypothetical protein
MEQVRILRIIKQKKSKDLKHKPPKIKPNELVTDKIITRIQPILSLHRGNLTPQHQLFRSIHSISEEESIISRQGSLQQVRTCKRLKKVPPLPIQEQ